MKNYILKEYGSWAVLITAGIAGIIVAGRIDFSVILSLLGLSLFVNSRQAFVMWQRLRKKEGFYAFIAQIFIGLVLLLFAEGYSIFSLYPLAFIPLLYFLSFLFLGEHSLVTEISGFMNLCLSSLIAFFSLTGKINAELYIIVSLFFVAGVFRVRLQLKKGIKERIMMLLYLFFTFIIYLLLKVNPWILLPFIDNLIFALSLYKVKLKVTGWIETVKGLIFLLLLYLFL